jgi:hypothetical protein
MQQRFELRKQQLLAECDLGPETFDGIIERLADFVEPVAIHGGIVTDAECV